MSRGGSSRQTPATAAHIARWGVEALNGEVTQPAWATKPSFYLVATDDHMTR